MYEVPLYIDIMINTAVEKHNFDCSHVLFEMLNGYKGTGTTYLAIGNAAVPVYMVYLGRLDITACYIKTSYKLTSAMNNISLQMSRIQYGPSLAPYNVPTEAETLAHLMYIPQNLEFKNKTINYKPEYYPLFEACISGKRVLSDLKVSSRHLKHITLHELRLINPETLRRRIAFIIPLIETLARSNLHESMFCGLVTWAYILKGKDRVLAERSGIWKMKYNNVESFTKWIKDNFSLRLKAAQNTISTNLATFFELEVLANRGIGEMDWNEEKSNRIRPDLANVSADEVYLHAKHIFGRIKNKCVYPNNMSFDTFFKKRWQWSPTGSVHSQYNEDTKYFSKDRSLRNKLFCFSRMEKKDFDYFLKREPECRAWPSIKYEWTKMRAIYGVDLTNFVMSSYGMLGAEELLSYEFPIGASAESSMVAATVKEVLRNGVPFCLDFEDFNSQHSIGSMKAVLVAYLSTFSNTLHEQQILAIDWLIKSLENTYVKDENGRWYKTKGTLMSGWRLTTFMNTILNKIYTLISIAHDELVSSHNGDDVLAAVNSYSDVQRIMYGAAKHNIRIQTSKCFFFSIGEFLRIDHRSKGTQYMSRAVATFVHGPTESLVPNDLQALLMSNKTRAEELVTRGADKHFVDELLLIQSKHIAKEWGVQEEDINKIYITHQSLGGMSKEISRASLEHRIETRETHRQMSEKAEEDANNNFPGAYDYARVLTETFLPKEYFTKVYNAVRKAVLHNSVSKRFGVFIKTHKADHITTIRAQKYGSLRKSVNTQKLSMAKSYGIPVFSILGAIDTIIEQMMGEPDKLEALKLLL